MRTAHWILCVSVSLLSTAVDLAESTVTNAPQNTVSLVGQKVTFQCQTSNTNRDRPVYWQFTNVNGVLQPQIYIGQMNPDYATRGFSVSNSSSSLASEYNLTIANVSLTDAGTYTCQDDNGIGEARAAWLTVLNTDPICFDPLHAVVGVTNLTCMASMYGRISDSNRLVPVGRWANCYDASESVTTLNDSFHRHYTWQSYLNVSADVNATFILNFIAVVSDGTIDSRPPTYNYRYSWSYSYDASHASTSLPTKNGPTATIASATINAFAPMIAAPQNTVSLAGHSVTFQCTTNNTNRPVYWQFTNVSGVLQPPIYNGQMNPDYATRRFSVSNSSSSLASEYNLTILGVSLTDAGTYTCQDNNGIGEARAAWLAVLGEEPRCFVQYPDALRSDVIANVTDITCTVSIYGRISDSNRLVPVFDWINCPSLINSSSFFQTLTADMFYREYTSWAELDDTGDETSCTFRLSFAPVVLNDTSVDVRNPTYSYTHTFVLSSATRFSISIILLLQLLYHLLKRMTY